jgi:DNA-binding winged helix-turn-helix (wHTH) protein
MTLLNQQPKQLYEFGPFCLDPQERMLLRDGKHVPLTPKAYETLEVLVQNSGRLVEKEELIRTIWPDSFVEEGGLTRNISVLRKALSNGTGEPSIQTIARRGYRLVAKVRKRIETVPTLRWIDAGGLEQTFSLREEEITIGRKSDTDLVLLNPYVSRHHAKLKRNAEGHTLVDLNSSHGTFVNGQRITSHQLKPGDRIALGKDRVELVYFTDDGETSGREPRAEDKNCTKQP